MKNIKNYNQLLNSPTTSNTDFRNINTKRHISSLKNEKNTVLKEKRDTDKLINLLMIDGKKSVASRLVFDALFILKRKYLPNASLTLSISKDLSNSSKISLSRKDRNNISTNLSVLEVLSLAIENVTPSVEVRKVRRAGNTFLIPAILSQHKANTLAMRWIIDSARKKQQSSNLNFSECLADEIYQAYSKQGKARQKRDELHNVATSNRANIRFRWW